MSKTYPELSKSGLHFNVHNQGGSIGTDNSATPKCVKGQIALLIQRHIPYLIHHTNKKIIGNLLN